MTQLTVRTEMSTDMTSWLKASLNLNIYPEHEPSRQPLQPLPITSVPKPSKALLTPIASPRGCTRLCKALQGSAGLYTILPGHRTLHKALQDPKTPLEHFQGCPRLFVAQWPYSTQTRATSSFWCPSETIQKALSKLQEAS